MDTIETIDNTQQITESSASHEQKMPKPSQYAKIKNNPEALEKFKQKRKEYYNKLKLIRQSLPPELLPEKKHYIITPEKKHEYNVKYYNTHKDQVQQYLKNYRQKEMSKENSSFINFTREWQKKRYHEVIKNCPEKMELRRERAREYYSKKRLEKQQANQQ